MTLSLGVKKVESLLQSDRALAKKVERMERNLKERSKKNTLLPLPDPITVHKEPKMKMKVMNNLAQIMASRFKGPEEFSNR